MSNKQFWMIFKKLMMGGKTDAEIKSERIACAQKRSGRHTLRVLSRSGKEYDFTPIGGATEHEPNNCEGNDCGIKNGRTTDRIVQPTS